MNNNESNTKTAEAAEKNIAGAAAGAPAGLMSLPVSVIIPDPLNRKDHDPEKLKQLAASIAADGLMAPIVVRRSKIAGAQWQIVAGERRWLACKLNGAHRIMAREAQPVDEQQAVRQRVAENLHRENLTPVEEAEVLQQMADTGMAVKAIAEFTGWSQPTVSNTLRLLKLPAPVRAMVTDGRLTRAHGVSLVRFARWPKICQKIAEGVIEDEMSSKDLEVAELPFAYQLEEDGMVVEIRVVKSWSGDESPIYTLPESLAKDEDFVKKGDRFVMYFREPGTADKWEPEKRKQDAARQAKAAAKQARAKAEGKLTPEQVERKKTIAKNREARAKIADALKASVRALSGEDAKDEGSGVFGRAIQVLLEAALADGRHGNRLEEAAVALGLKLPKRPQGGGGYRKLQFGWLWNGFGLVDAARVSALAVMMREAADATRFVGGVPESVQLLAECDEGDAPAPAASKPGSVVGKPSPAMTKAYVDAIIAQVRELYDAGVPKPEIFTRMGNLPATIVRKAYDLVVGTPGKKRLATSARKPRLAGNKIGPEIKELVKQRVCEGKTGAEIAGELRISLPSVQNIKKELGLIKPRVAGEEGGAK